MSSVRFDQLGVAFKLEMTGGWFCPKRLKQKNSGRQRVKIFFMASISVCESANVNTSLHFIFPKIQKARLTACPLQQTKPTKKPAFSLRKNCSLRMMRIKRAGFTIRCLGDKLFLKGWLYTCRPCSNKKPVRFLKPYRFQSVQTTNLTTRM